MIYFQSLTKDELSQLIYTSEPGETPPRRWPRLKPRGEDLFEKLEADLKKKANVSPSIALNRFFTGFTNASSTEWDRMTDLSKELRSWLKGERRDFPFKRTRFSPELGRNT